MATQHCAAVPFVASTVMAMALMFVPAAIAGQFGTPKENEGTRIFQAIEHPYYSGQFHLSGQRTTLIGSVNDRAPWDHLDYAGKRLTPVQGSIDIQVNEVTNSGQVGTVTVSLFASR